MEDLNQIKLLQRLRELEIENIRLREKSDQTTSQKLIVTEGEYQGHTVLTFQRGTNRPFNLGLKKLEIIKEALPQIERFLNKHKSPGQNAGSLLTGHFDEDKI